MKASKIVPKHLPLALVASIFVGLLGLGLNSAHAELSEPDCRVCHEDLDVVTYESPEAHHHLTDTPCGSSNIVTAPDWRYETCDQTGGFYACFSCHGNEWDPERQVWVFETIRDCLQCHIQSDITSASILDGIITIAGSGFDEVIDSDTVYVDPVDGTGSCDTTVLQWMDDLIVTGSDVNPDGSYCASVGDTVVVPCAIAEALLADGSCIPTSSREKGKDCKDNIDNDCDGAVDGDDPDCGGGGGPPGGGDEEICDDGIDNDGDGKVDCADKDCKKDPAC